MTNKRIKHSPDTPMSMKSHKGVNFGSGFFLQPVSSELSLQSDFPLHTRVLLMHVPSRHSNWPAQLLMLAILSVSNKVTFRLALGKFSADDIKPHFYIVKLGFTWVHIFLISAQKT